MNKIPLEEAKKRLFKSHQDTITIVEKTYKGMHQKCTLIDKEYGSWEAIPYNIIKQKQRHPLNKAKKMKINNPSQIHKKALKDYEFLLKKRGGKFISKNFVNYQTKYLIECKYGHQWQTTISKLKLDRWCPICYKLRRTPTVNDLKNLAEKRSGTLLSKKYINSKTKYKIKCKFGHVFKKTYNSLQQGQWCPVCANKTRRQTCLKNYGVKWPAQNKEIRLKISKTKNQVTVLKHWKTGKEVSCIGSYEVLTTKFFNKNKIHFEKEPKTFFMPGGRTYTPDFYLPNQDLWIEIKGFFYDDAQEKWEWFHQQYPNSELWNKEVLIEKKIIC